MSDAKNVRDGCDMRCSAAAAPRSASADWLVTPFVGWNFGGSADVNGAVARASRTVRAQGRLRRLRGRHGRRHRRFEADFGYSPNFFETRRRDNNGFEFTNDSNVDTLTGNVIVGAPIGGHGGSIRPYLVGGVGLIRTQRAGRGRTVRRVRARTISGSTSARE